MAPSGRRSKTKPDDLGCESACTGCPSLHPPSPFIITTQPECSYSFYRPTEGRRLSRFSWLVTYRDDLYPSTDGHPSRYNRVWRSTTTLMEANALPLSQTANCRKENIFLSVCMAGIKFGKSAFLLYSKICSNECFTVAYRRQSFWPLSATTDNLWLGQLYGRPVASPLVTGCRFWTFFRI